jgi:mono/diheme cytochrome c family protein
MVCSLLFVGCKDKGSAAGGEAKKAASTATAKAADLDAAKKVYAARCVVCHGATGKGDGAGAANLTPKPRSFADKDWQKKVTDDAIRTVILKGGLAVGKSPTMPPQADLKAKPEVIAGLVALVRSMGK